MKDFNWITAFTIFCVYVLFDILYALYVICVSRRQAIAASVVGSLMYSLSAFGVMNYTNNPWYLLPLSFGAFIGTYVAVKYMGDWHK